MSTTKKLMVFFLLVSIGIGLWFALFNTAPKPQTELVLFGNVDLRQVSLAFNNSERINEVLAQEGEYVRRGQILARLDTSRLRPRLAEISAQTEAQRHVVERMHNGSRPQEITQARANLQAAQADAEYERLQYQRLSLLSQDSAGKAVSKQDLDSHLALQTSAQARLLLQQKSLELMEIGPRKEDVAQAEAQLQALEAQLAFLTQQIQDAELLAPAEAVVRSRLLEPGEMSSPQRPVYSLALVNPKWVRAYAGETELGHLQSGAQAQISVDSFPGQRFAGWVGFISPVAEFTPKPVQTEELRPSLSYEVRVFVKDADDRLRLGMPATVHVLLTQTDVK